MSHVAYVAWAHFISRPLGVSRSSPRVCLLVEPGALSYGRLVPEIVRPTGGSHFSLVNTGELASLAPSFCGIPLGRPLVKALHRLLLSALGANLGCHVVKWLGGNGNA